MQKQGDSSISIEMNRIDILDICKMIGLSENVDDSILDVPRENIKTLQNEFHIHAGNASDEITVAIPKEQIRDLSQVLEGVSVVDTDDFFPGAQDIPNDNRMQELANSITEMYHDAYGMT